MFQLETERLKLRPHRLEDFAALAAMWADPAVTRHIGGKPSSEQQSWARLLIYLGHWSLMDFGYWAVEEKSSGRYIGEVGFADFKRDLKPSIHGVPEAGWVFATRAHGQGYATEALRAALGWAEGRPGFGRTVCIIDPGNVASVRVAQKCGYRELGPAIYNGEKTVLYER